MCVNSGQLQDPTWCTWPGPVHAKSYLSLCEHCLVELDSLDFLVSSVLWAFTFFLPLLQWDSLSPERRHLMEPSSFFLFLAGIWSNRLHHGTFLCNLFLNQKSPFYCHITYVILHSPFFIMYFLPLLSLSRFMTCTWTHTRCMHIHQNWKLESQ